MAFTIPTLDTVTDFVVGVMRALFPTKNWSKFSPGWKFFRGVSVATSEIHAHVKTMLKDLLPDTASGTYLDRWGVIRGVARKSATPARKSNALRVRGVVASTYATGDLLTHAATGLTFKLTAGGVIPAAGYVDVSVVGVDVGSQTRLSKGEVLKFSAPAAGINEEATLVLALDEDGVDQEADSAYRARILDRFANPPLGGAQTDYVQWALEVTGIATAFAYPLRAGKNSVDVAALHTGSGATRVLSAGENATLLAYINGKRPVGVALRVLTVNTQLVDVEVTVSPYSDVAYEFDWDDSTPPVALAWTGATRTLQFTAARPASMAAGDRLTIKPTAGGGDGVQHVIESLSGLDSVVLQDVPSQAPVATDTIYSGGQLVDTIRNAIVAHIDSLGPTNTDAAQYGNWEADLRPSNLYRIAQAVTGVKKSTVVLPAAVVEPADTTYPNDTAVNLLIPGRVLVRKE